jgi:quinol monooxygenase YgiN
MSTEVSWRVEIAINDGQLVDFLSLTVEMVEFTKSENGVLSYQRFVSHDGRTVHVYQRYADSHAALTHLENFAERFAPRFSGMVSRRQFDVYGEPTEELKSVLNGFGATQYFNSFGNLAYWGDSAKSGIRYLAIDWAPL